MNEWAADELKERDAVCVCICHVHVSSRQQQTYISNRLALFGCGGYNEKETEVNAHDQFTKLRYIAHSKKMQCRELSLAVSLQNERK